MYFSLFIVSSNLNIVIHDATGICKVWMFGVDVGQLNRNQVVDL